MVLVRYLEVNGGCLGSEWRPAVLIYLGPVLRYRTVRGWYSTYPGFGRSMAGILEVNGGRTNIS